MISVRMTQLDSRIACEAVGSRDSGGLVASVSPDRAETWALLVLSAPLSVETSGIEIVMSGSLYMQPLVVSS